MFDIVREKKRWVQAVLALIILPFALWGLDSYNRPGNTMGDVATVNDAKISQLDFDNALRQQQDKMRQQLGNNFDPTIFENPEFKRAVMDGLIMQRLLTDYAKKAGLFVTDEQIAGLVGGIEAFQEEGKFDKKRYEAVLRNQNMSPLMFEARIREHLLGQQMQDAYAQNGFASARVVDNLIRLNEQQRVIRVSQILPQTFMAQAKVDDAAIKQYYEQNKKEFQTQEQAKVEYVIFSLKDLLAKIEISKEDVKKYYDDHQSEYGTQEERQAAHILISANAMSSKADKEAARAKAELLLQQARKSPNKFAELAKLNSQDVGSAANGGDLGFFGRGMMVKPFEDAAFSLKEGEISELVKSDFGYHIIKLIAVKPSRILPFEEAREGIANKLRQQKASDKYAELADQFNNTVYEQSDTLKPAADLINAKIEQSGWLTKGMAASEPWTAKMLQAIFNDETIKNKRNTAAIEIAPDTLVAARILEHKPAAERTLGEVQGAIRQKLLNQQATEAAVKNGTATLEQLQSGNNVKLKWSNTETISRGKLGSLDAGLAQLVFQASAASLPQYVGAEAPQGGYKLVRVEAVKEGEAITEGKRALYMQQLRQITGGEILQAYMADAKKQAAIKINLPENTTMQP